MDGWMTRELDEVAARSLRLRPAAEIDGWQISHAPELPFRRANAVLPPAMVSPEPVHGFAAVQTWCRDHEQRVLVQVPDGGPGHRELDAFLAAQGLAVEAPVHVLVADLGVAAPHDVSRAEAHRVAVTVVTGDDEQELESAVEAHGGPRLDGYLRLIAAREARGLVAVAPGAGVGFGVVDRPWVGIFGMATDPAHRRQGVATAVLAALLDAARARGAARAYLQVETDNEGARRCYERAGFRRSHGYHYRAEPT